MKKSLIAFSFFTFVMFFLYSYASASISHKVRAGDTLQKIAKKYHVSVDKLKSMNNLRSGSLKRGQVLTIETETASIKSTRARQQAKKATKRPATPVIQEAAVEEEHDNSEYIEYRVRRGDTLDKLSTKFNIDKEELLDLNNIKKTKLKPGTTVFIPRAEEDAEETPLVLNERPLKPWENEEERGILVKVAKSFSGAPYRFGGDSVRGLDCSAFVKKMYEIFEVQLPRSAREQFYAGQKVNKEELTTGDLVFFKTKRYAKYPTHVGIYIGEDKFIHASSHYKRGVRMDSLADTYFTRTYTGAVRVKAPPAEKGETTSNLQKIANDT